MKRGRIARAWRVRGLADANCNVRALRLVAATLGAASSPRALRLASRAVRQLTVSAAVCAAAIAGAIEDGAIRDRGVVHIAGADAADFLDHDRNAAQFSAGAS